MLAFLDNLLRHLLMADVADITSEDQVRFQPPDDDWRTYVSTLTIAGKPVNALNVYLVDLRENRKLRTNERVRSSSGGDVFDEPAPRRMDCHYLISAWSPALITPLVEPTIDEHALLADVATALANHDSLIPTEVYAPDPLPPGFPAYAADAELPTTLMPVDGFLKLAEFWGTMGQHHRWKPAIYLVVTIPLAIELQRSGPMVTTRIAEFRVSGQPSTGEIFVQIGGFVRDSGKLLPDGTFAPVAGASVQLQAPPGTAQQLAQTDALGRFTFNSLRPGNFRLIATAADLGPVQRDVTVPSPSGEYDMQF